MPRQGAILAEGERPREKRRRGQRVLELKEVLGLGHRCLELAVVHFLVSIDGFPEAAPKCNRQLNGLGWNR